MSSKKVDKVTNETQEKQYTAYKVRIYPTTEQAKKIDKNIDGSRFVYNKLLEIRSNTHELSKDEKTQTLYEIAKHCKPTVKRLRECYPHLLECSSKGLNGARRHVEQAFENFFNKSLKQQYPKFKSRFKAKQNYTEQYENQKPIDIENKTLSVVKIYDIEVQDERLEQIKGVKNITVSKRGTGKYFASLQCEVERTVKERNADGILGIDMGIKNFIVTSDGEKISTWYDDETKRLLKRVGVAQGHLSRKTKGSARRKLAQIKVNKRYEDMKNRVDSIQWKLANYFCQNNKAIGIENLAIKNIMKNKKLAPKFQRYGISDFIQKLKQKAEEYGTIIFESDRFYASTQICSACGYRKTREQKLKLKDRVYQCDKCLFVCDRDLNASYNLKKQVIEFLQSLSAVHVDCDVNLDVDDRQRGDECLQELNFNSQAICHEAFTTSTKSRVKPISLGGVT